MHLSEAQRLIGEIYLHRDRERGAERTLLWLVEEVGELARAHRHGSRKEIEEELADVLAWLLSYANLLDIELEEAFRKKYPGTCTYCSSSPCSCGK